MMAKGLNDQTKYLRNENSFKWMITRQDSIILKWKTTKFENLFFVFKYYKENVYVYPKSCNLK